MVRSFLLVTDKGIGIMGQKVTHSSFSTSHVNSREFNTAGGGKFFMCSFEQKLLEPYSTEQHG